MSTVKGTDVLAKNIVKFTNGFLKQVNADMRASAFVLDKAIEKNISLTDHTLKDLADMDHPYSRRHTGNLHDPQYQVHTQTGRLLDSKFSGSDPASIDGGQLRARAYAGVSERVPHAIPVIYGTRKMVPRDFLRGSLMEVKDRIFETLSRSLKNTVISFNGDKAKL